MIEIDEIVKVQGLYYLDEIDVNTTDILEKIDSMPWYNLTKSINSRKVQHYGFKYNYTTYDIYEKCEDIPDFLNEIKDFLTFICLELKIINSNYIFNQCIINNYDESQGISPHVDVLKYGDVIGCFTLHSGATITFTKNDEIYELYVKPQSLYIMSGDSRYEWKHSMTGKKYDIIEDKKIKRGRRISITFRNVPLKN